MRLFLKDNLSSYLRGFGQIMLQANALTGLLFLVAIAINSWVMLLGALLGGLSGWAAARLLGYERLDIENGLYGFNAALVGICVFFFYELGFIACFLVVVGGGVSSLIMKLMRSHCGRLPPYTAPFIITAWLVLGLAEWAGLAPVISVGVDVNGRDITSVLLGIGLVIFQLNGLSAFVVLAGLLLSSRNAAVWALLGSAMGMLVGRCFGYSEDLLVQGLYGYSAVLAAIALACCYGETVLPILLGIVFAVFITHLFTFISLPALTAPFVLATWLVTVLMPKGGLLIKWHSKV